MSEVVNKEEQEKREILRQYRRLIEVWNVGNKTTKDKWLVRKAFRMAADAHRDMRRKSGEPFIMHPLAVAIIVAKDIGLGRTSIISSLLHDTVEDTIMTLDEIDGIFGEKVAKIIDGLTKIDNISIATSTAQAETLKKILLTLSDDIRVILIKLADRIHNMRTLDSMPKEKQLRVVSETQYIYAPLAYRLGLYKIKSELEELSFKYSEPKIYKEINDKLSRTEDIRIKSYNAVVEALSPELDKNNFEYEIRLNVKTANSIWQKMRKREESFKNIYNTYSIDIILNAEPSEENDICWHAYSIISRLFRSNTKRLRDWISTPKANGYEAVHTTIMNITGQWVDIHIRSKRMDEIANKGYAAYWKYKDLDTIDASLENWVNRTKTLIEENEEDTFSFLSDFKRNLFSDEIFVFTPAGEVINLPYGATVLDFAYTIHTDIGNQCIGANINHKIASLGQKLNSGEQVEIITSKIQKPSEEWYKYVITARAKSRIAHAIKTFRKSFRIEGQEKLKQYFEQQNIEFNKHNINQLLAYRNLNGIIDLYYFVAKGTIGLKEVKEIKEILQPTESRLRWIRNFRLPFTKPRITSNENANDSEKANENTDENSKPKVDYISDFATLDYIVSDCCNPIPGDNVMGLVFPNEPIQIHKTNCETAIKLMSQHGKNIVKAKWKQQAGITFLAGLKIQAADNFGLIREIISPITDEFKINIRTFDLTNSEGIVNIKITIYVSSTKELKMVISRLKKINSIIKIIRLDKI